MGLPLKICLISFLLLGIGSLSLPLSVYADDNPTIALPSDIAPLVNSTLISANEFKWTAAPTTLPVGAEIAVVDGDPTKVGPYTLYLKFPAKYQIPPFSFSLDNRTTVISGTLNVGLGDKFDDSKLKPLPTSSFIIFRANDHVFISTNEETEIEISGIGPWIIQTISK